MRILHLPMEVGGQVGEICKQLRSLGCQAVGYNWRHNYLKYDHSMLHSDAYEMTNTLEFALSYFDIFHYHTGYTLFKNKMDLQMVRSAGKKVVMHHRGNDVRMPSKAANGNPYLYTGDSQPEKQIIANLKLFSKHVSTVIVPDYELYDYVADYYEKVHIVPRLFDSSKLETVIQVAQKRRALVVHAPTSRAFKGTDSILRTVELLKKDIEFDFVLIEKFSRKQAMEVMQGADIVIDQVLCGMYGNVSVEGMAFGKAVVCYLRPDVAARLPKKLPIVSANPDNLYDELKHLLLNRERVRVLGQRGIQFVKEYHDAASVTKQLLDIYRTL